MRRLSKNLLLVVWLVCLPTTLPLADWASAATEDEREPVRINARSVVANDKTGAVVYSGKVVVEQGPLTIRADRIEYSTRRSGTEQMIATGKPVRLHQRNDKSDEELRAEAERVIYSVAKREIEMTGHVMLQQGSNRFTADRLHYELDTNRLSAEGSESGDGRVHVVIQPKSVAPDAPSKSGDNDGR